MSFSGIQNKHTLDHYCSEKHMDSGSIYSDLNETDWLQICYDRYSSAYYSRVICLITRLHKLAVLINLFNHQITKKISPASVISGVPGNRFVTLQLCFSYYL